MRYKRNLLYNALELPAYWWATHRAKRRLIKGWTIKKVPYGPHRRQYTLSVVDQSWANDPESNAQRPLAIYFHGGAWTFGSPEQFLPAARLFVEAGYETLLPSHRRLPRHNFRHILADLESMRDQVLRGRRVIVLAGMSAGGHLAAWLGGHPEFWATANLEPPQKLIGCGAVVDFSRMNFSFGLRLLAGRPKGELHRLANPAPALLSQNQTSLRQLFVHGTDDGMVGFEQVACYFASQDTQTASPQRHWLPGGTHLDACRWMYRDDTVAARIRQFLAAK